MVRVHNVEQAERASRGRAAVMALAAVVMMLNAVIEFGSAPYSVLGLRGAVWIPMIGAWLFILAKGGGLSRDRLTSSLLNDELSLQNRARALSFGFYATMIAGLLIYAGSWYQEIGVRDALRLVTAVGISGALARYAWLEVR